MTQGLRILEFLKNTPITPKKLNLQKILINLQIINNIIVKIHK